MQDEITAATAAQIAANIINAQFSTGPKTAAGKAKCSHNAIKTALTGKTILLPTDDVVEYQDFSLTFIDEYRPATPQEDRLVQSMIEDQWRLMRIPVLIAGVYAVGRRKLADSVPAEMLEAEVYLAYEKNLKNLDLQETRLRRNYEKDLKTLREVQSLRFRREAMQRQMEQRKAAQEQAGAAEQAEEDEQPTPEPETNSQIGSVFSTLEIDAKAA